VRSCRQAPLGDPGDPVTPGETAGLRRPSLEWRRIDPPYARVYSQTMPRRRYAELEPAPEAELAESPAPTPVAEAEPPSRSAPTDTPHGRVLALQQGAGNAATGRLLRMRAAELGVAGAPEGPGAVAQAPAGPAVPAPGVLDEDAAQTALADHREERALLEGSIIPDILDRLMVPGYAGIQESLTEVTLLARNELHRQLRESSDVMGPIPMASTVIDIQIVVMRIARQRNIIVPGHRPPGDAGGLEMEAKALGDLIGVQMRDLEKVEPSAGGIVFEFKGELRASTVMGGTDLSLKGGPSGVEGTMSDGDRSLSIGGGPGGVRMSGAAGPLTLGGAAAKDSGKVELKIDAGPVELKGEISAKKGEQTTWLAAIEIKIAGGADPLPDPASMAQLVKHAGADIAGAASYLDAAVAGTASTVDRRAIEERLGPAKKSLEEVVAYMEKHREQPDAGPSATIGVEAKSSADGSVSAQLTLTIRF